MNQFLQGTVTILSLVNPMICAAIFSRVSAGKSWHDKVISATSAALAITVILCMAALGGAQVLNVFGISLSAFQVAGGMVLVWMGFIMLRGNSSPTSTTATDEDEPGDEKQELDGGRSLTPLILFAASPGTITGVITLAVSHSEDELPVTALVSVTAAIAITWLTLIVTSRSSGENKGGLMHDVTSRFMGLIVLAMGVQFALSGLNQFFQPQ